MDPVAQATQHGSKAKAQSDSPGAASDREGAKSDVYDWLVCILCLSDGPGYFRVCLNRKTENIEGGMYGDRVGAIAYTGRSTASPKYASVRQQLALPKPEVAELSCTGRWYSH